MTQRSMIVAYMKEHGSITTYEAFEQLGITKLTTRISELRAGGFKIRQRTEAGLNRFGKAVSWNRYWIEDEKQNKAGSVVIP